MPRFGKTFLKYFALDMFYLIGIEKEIKEVVEKQKDVHEETDRHTDRHRYG